MNLSKKLILVLDTANADQALAAVQNLKEYVQYFKVGLELFTSAGPDIIQKIKSLGGNVFLDLKLHDIPNTVERTCRVIQDYGVFMTTLHCSGGKEMLMAAKKAISENSDKPKPLLVGVTVLTSLTGSLEEILKRAELAKQCGLDGVVCSVHEVKAIKEKLGKNFITVTPGIRLDENASADDQKRVATISEALKVGSDYLVLGRAIFQTPNPKETLKKLIEQYS